MRNLLDVKKHSTKVAKLIAMVQLKKHNVECYLEKTSEAVALGAVKSEILEEFKKDISKTAKDLYDIQGIINSIKNGRVTEYDSIYNTVEDVFGITYNKETNTIKLCGVAFDAGAANNIKKLEIEDIILKEFFDITKKELSNLAKAIKRYEEEKDEIKKAILYPSVAKADEIIKKIANEDLKFNSFINSLSYEEEEEFSKTFKRTGISGVIQNSTYISKEGIKQLAPSHKIADAKRLESLLTAGLKCIEAIEVDGDGSLEKTAKLVEQIEKLKLNLDVKFTLKIRKLGNYKARGLFMKNQLIVAEDVRDTSAILHEIGHLVHLTRFENDDFVNYLISKLSKRVVLDDDIPFSKANYYLKPTEIVARACEIAGMFARQDGDLTIKDDEFDIIKDEAYYASNPGIYFNYQDFDDVTRDELKALYKLFFQTASNEARDSNINNFIKIDTCYKKIEEKKGWSSLAKDLLRVKKELKALYSQVIHSNIEAIFDAYQGDIKNLARVLITNLKYWGGHKDRMNLSEWRDAIEDKSGVLNFIFDRLFCNLSKRDFALFMVEFKKHGWQRVLDELFFNGFSIDFRIQLKKFFGENTPENNKLKSLKEKMRKNASYFYNNKELLKDESFVKELAATNPFCLRTINAILIDLNLLAKVTKEHLEIDDQQILNPGIINKALGDDIEFAKFIVSFQDGRYIYLFDEDSAIRNDKEVFKEGKLLSYMGSKLINDIEFAREMMKKRDTLLEYFSRSVQEEVNKPTDDTVSEFEELIASGEIIDFERTDGKGVEKVLKIRKTINNFRAFNQYMKSNKIGYYSRFAKGFILYEEYLNKGVAA